MGVVLIPAIVLVVVLVMAATLRSLSAGLVIGLLVVAVLAVTGGADWDAAAAAGAVAAAGVALAFGARGRLPTGWALLFAALPLAAVFAASALTIERPVLEAELATWVEREAGAALTPELRADMAHWLLGLVPASAALVSFLLVLVAYAVAMRWLPRFGFEVQRLGPMGSLVLPFWVVWSFAVALLMCAVGRGLRLDGLLLAGANLAMVHGAAFFVQGLAVGWKLLTLRAMPGLMLLILAVLALVMAPITLAVIVIGLLDQWFDFRRLLAPREEGNGSGGGGS